MRRRIAENGGCPVGVVFILDRQKPQIQDELLLIRRNSHLPAADQDQLQVRRVPSAVFREIIHQDVHIFPGVLAARIEDEGLLQLIFLPETRFIRLRNIIHPRAQDPGVHPGQVVEPLRQFSLRLRQENHAGQMTEAALKDAHMGVTLLVQAGNQD